MESDEESPTHLPQCLAGSVMGRRNVEVKGGGERSSNDKVGWTVGVKTSKPRMSVKLSSVSDGNKSCMTHHHYSDDEHEDDSDNNYEPGTVYAKVEPSQKGIQHRKDKGTAVAQTQMPSTKPKARVLVASRQMIDGHEVASLRDQSHPPLLTLTGTVHLAATDPIRPSSVQAAITGKASVSAVLQDTTITEPRSNRQLSNINRQETKAQYYKDLCKQVEERKQQRERERRRNTSEEQEHNDTMQHSIWGCQEVAPELPPGHSEKDQKPLHRRDFTPRADL